MSLKQPVINGANMIRIFCIIAALTLITAGLTACGKRGEPKRPSEVTETALAG